MLSQIRSVRRAALVAVAALAVGACSEDEHDHEAEVDFMRVTVGAQQVMVNSTGAVTGGPISVTSGAATAVTVAFLDADMADALAEHADDYQANIAVPAGMTFTRTGPFTGTLTGSVAGTSNVSFTLFHIEENHEDFGPFNVPVTVTVPPTVVAR
jgi:hypothetical protein